jgi:thymidylate synthase
MRVIKVRNVHQALPEALYQLSVNGVDRDSRNGPVRMFPEPVTTVYERPAERVLFWKERDANPFFHLYESLWMLGGRNDVESVAAYVENIRNYSDDGVTFHGAYGYRWRNHFANWQVTNLEELANENIFEVAKDQLPLIINALRENQDDRRQVLSMWDANVDLGRQGKDLPCNLQAIFQVAPDGRLDMTVTNRSNDIVWGAYGANAVHFSYLHEYVARSIGVEQGIYRQVSTNFHAYHATLTKVDCLGDFAIDMSLNSGSLLHDPYIAQAVEPFPLISIDPAKWNDELEMFLGNPDTIGLTDPFFRRVAYPMCRAHREFKNKSNPNRFESALDWVDQVKATDWQLAAREWLARRWEAAKAKKANDDGVTYD